MLNTKYFIELNFEKNKYTRIEAANKSGTKKKAFIQR